MALIYNNHIKVIVRQIGIGIGFRKLKSGRLGANVEAYLRKLKEQWEELPPYFVTSSENRLGRKELLDYIESINKELKP